VLLQHS